MPAKRLTLCTYMHTRFTVFAFISPPCVDLLIYFSSPMRRYLINTMNNTHRKRRTAAAPQRKVILFYFVFFFCLISRLRTYRKKVNTYVGTQHVLSQTKILGNWISQTLYRTNSFRPKPFAAAFFRLLFILEPKTRINIIYFYIHIHI